MSLATSIGREMNVFCEAEGQAHRLSFKSPILLYSDFKQLTTMSEHHYRADWLDINLWMSPKPRWTRRLRRCAIKRNRWCATAPCYWSSQIAISVRIACRYPRRWRVGAVQTRLVEQSLRCDANIIVETGSARDPHHFAVLLGFGATAIYPYLAYETLGASD
nr:glutamate synthase subunit alpha [Salmonella sp. NCTC 7297]